MATNNGHILVVVLRKLGHILVVVLRKLDYLEQLLAAVMEAGVSGMTIINTRGISHASFKQTVSEFSIAAVLSTLFMSEKHESKVLLCVVDSDELCQELCRRMDDAISDTAIYFTLPVENLRGLTK